jgi:hypothetical protein
MSAQIRPVTGSDLPQVIDLLITDAEQRHSTNPALWPMVANIHEHLDDAVTTALNKNSTFEELWLLAQDSGRTIGVSRAMMLPIPPIYAGKSGLPGLILGDCFTAKDAPLATEESLLLATESALRDSGATLLLASCLAEGQRRSLLERHGYKAITLYMGKVGFEADNLIDNVRPANSDDIPEIVAASAKHRDTLSQISDRFWNIHPDADERFGNWMKVSLGLTDRDMLVAGGAGQVQGYIIAQPISALLVPTAHEVKALGVIDDFYHVDFAHISEVENDGMGAANLLLAAESAFAERNVEAALVVCPAGWASKISVLEQQGYQSAKVWMLKD